MNYLDWTKKVNYDTAKYWNIFRILKDNLMNPGI